MIAIPGGTFRMGGNDPDANPGDGEGPVRQVTLRPFHIDATAVSNTEFADFVKATGYVTEAERYEWSYIFRRLRPSRRPQARHQRQRPRRTVVARRARRLLAGPGRARLLDR